MTVASSITRVGVSVLRAPVADPVPMAFGSLLDRRVCVVEIEADGLVGVGESWINYPAWAHHERIATLIEGVVPLLLGRDAGDPAQVQRTLWRALGAVGRQAGSPGPIWQALSGVDLALWDLAARRRGVPLHTLLEGDVRRTRVPVYASGVGPTQVDELCARARHAGIRTLKAKIGFGADVDRQTLQQIRAAAPEATVLADANQSWDLATAKAQLALLEEHDVRWLEEPLAGDRTDELAVLAAATSIPLATGENVYGHEGFAAHLEQGRIGYLQPDLAKSGGYSQINPVTARAGRRGVQVAPHCYSSGLGLLAALHLAAAWSHVPVLELDVRDNPLRDGLFPEVLAVVDGHLSVPDGPGLGAVPDPDLLDDLRTHFQERTL